MENEVSNKPALVARMAELSVDVELELRLFSLFVVWIEGGVLSSNTSSADTNHKLLLLLPLLLLILLLLVVVDEEEEDEGVALEVVVEVVALTSIEWASSSS